MQVFCYPPSRTRHSCCGLHHQAAGREAIFILHLDMKRFRPVISFILLAALPQLLHAQPKNRLPGKRCPVRTINFEQGLLNNATTNIFTDASGFTWVSTKTGLQRFNGFVLETINPVAGKDTFRINYPVFFYGLQDGRLWITCRQGVLEYDLSGNAFKQVITVNEKNTQAVSPVIPLKETTEGIWCMQEGIGIVIYSREGKALKTRPMLDHALTDAMLNAAETQFRALFSSNDRYIFIRSRNNQVERIDTRNKNVITFHFNETIRGLAATRDNLYVISNLQLMMVNADDGSVKKTVRLKEILDENIFTSAVWAENENQLLVSLHGHLYQADSACHFQYELTDAGRNAIVPSGHITRLYTDKFRRIWVLGNNEIRRLENTAIPFAHFIYPDSKNNFVRSLYYDEDKHLVIAGCLGGGICLYDSLSNPLWEKPLITPDVKDVIAIEKLTRDDYLVITFGRGWFLLHLPTRQLRPFDLSAVPDKQLDPRAINFGNNIQRINSSTIALSTADNVYRCSLSGNKLTSVKPVFPLDKSTSAFNCFLYASDHTWWVGTTDGLLYRLSPNGDLQTTRIPERYVVRSITEDAAHHVWVGTDKGLCIYTANGILKKRITRETGLLNDCIYALLPAGPDAAVFASSNLGLSYVSAEGTINNYSKEVGLQDNEFNTGSAMRTSSARFFFGGVNGITAFYPSALNVVSDTPLIHVTRLVVNDSLYNSSAGSWSGDRIQLNYNQNHIQLDLSALGLLNSSEYLYKYRMKEFEEAWQTTRKPVGIKYVLEPGEYIFEISCTPMLSNSNAVVKRIMIIIKKPWWQTWWFRILAGLLAVSVIAFFVLQYNRRKYLQKIRTLQLQQEIQGERERISRDLHDSLGVYAASIASNIEQIKIAADDGAGKTALQELRSNAQSIVSQLGDTIWALKKDALSLTAISDRLKVFLQKVQLSYSGITINVSEQIRTDPVLPASQAFHLLQIVQEAVINAVRHGQCSSINFVVEGNELWTIRIEDNGKGMPAGTNLTSQGNGLYNMALRAKEAGWTIDWRPGSPSGTTVVITSATTN